MRKKKSNTWYDWLINYIPEPIEVGFKDKVVSNFDTNPPKETVHRERN